MASTFPAAIANEPPPLDGSSEDEDSEEFRSHGLKLDVPSGEPTPVSTPFKRPFNKSPDKIKTLTLEPDRAVDDLTLSLSREDSPNSPEEVYTDEDNDSRIALAADDKIEERVNGVELESNHEILEAKEEYNCNNTLFQDETPQQEVDVVKETNHCDSSTKLNYTNSNIPTLPVDTGSLDENAAAENTPFEEEHAYDSEASTNASKSADQESVSEDKRALSSNLNSNDNSTGTDEDEDKAEEFLQFQTFEEGNSSKSTDNLNQDDEDGPTEGNASVQPNGTDATLKSSQDDDNDDFEDDDFGAFQSIPHPHSHTQQENSVAENQEDDDDDDDFGDFAHNSVQVPPDKDIPVQPTKLMAQTSHEVIENFADFQDCSFQSSDGPGRSLVEPPSAAPSDITLINKKIDSVIKSLFVIESNIAEDEANKPNSIDSEISISGDTTWARVQDFEGSHGLMFKWLSSVTGKRLLRSLNINTSNIVYHEKWGTIEVPKFAASLVQSPLQPQSCNRLDSQAKSIEHPAIVNNNTIISDDHDKPPSISTEAHEILRQLPDLSYMRANTLVFPQSSPSGL